MNEIWKSIVEGKKKARIASSALPVWEKLRRMDAMKERQDTLRKFKQPTK